MLRKMDKISKVLAIVLLVVMALSMVGTVVFADDLTSGITSNTTGTEKIKTTGSQIIGIVQVVGYIIAVVMVIFVGIKYVTSAPEGKAELKKVMLYYIIGAVLIAAAVSVTAIIYNWGTNITA